MKAIILAAGQGTRLKKYTADLPKGMLNFEGKTIVERQLEVYRSMGIDDIIIVKGFAREKINYPGIKYYVNQKYAETNMVESLLTARDEFDDDIIISYSDILFEKEMLAKMMSEKGKFNVAVDDDWQYYWKTRYGRVDFDTESLTIDEDDNIVELGKENPKLEDIDARYVGLLKFSSKGLRDIVSLMEKAYVKYKDAPWQQSGKPVKKAYMTDLLNALIESGESVKAVHFKRGWIEFDTNEDYENAIEWLKNGIIKNIVEVY